MHAKGLGKGAPKAKRAKRRRIILVERGWRQLTDDEKQALCAGFSRDAIRFIRFEPVLIQSFMAAASREYLACCQKKLTKEDVIVLPSTEDFAAWVEVVMPAVEDGYTHLALRKGRGLEKVTAVGIIPYVP